MVCIFVGSVMMQIKNKNRADSTMHAYISSIFIFSHSFYFSGVSVDKLITSL